MEGSGNTHERKNKKKHKKQKTSFQNSGPPAKVGPEIPRWIKKGERKAVRKKSSPKSEIELLDRGCREIFALSRYGNM
jgi:hypothetical protein